jgi:uncharacterized protein HemX
MIPTRISTMPQFTALKAWAIVIALAVGAGAMGVVWVWHKREVSQAYLRGVADERAAWEKLALEAKIKKLELELKVARDAAGFASAAAEQLERELAAAREHYAEFIAGHQGIPVCVLGDDGARL